MNAPLYDRLGGEAAVMAAVDIFYQKVLADKSVSAFFDALDMEAQVQKQIAFMTWAFGGPAEYKGRDLRTAHASLVKRGLNNTHFDSIAGHLADTLKELGVPEDLIQESLTIVGGTRKEVLNQ